MSAPSGAGKTTIVRQLLREIEELAFSISACSREKRGNEIDGKDYYFLGVEGFKEAIRNDELVEWEEVYPNQFYGTLHKELTRIWDQGKTVVFDVDVVGGLNLKKKLGPQALAIFIMPPNVTTLEKRLRSRATESEDKINMRIGKAKKEISSAGDFDYIVENDVLVKAVSETRKLILDFLAS